MVKMAFATSSMVAGEMEPLGQVGGRNRSVYIVHRMSFAQVYKLMLLPIIQTLQNGSVYDG